MLKRIGICPDCSKRTPVRKDNTFGSHYNLPGAHCSGTGKPCNKIVAQYNVWR